ESLLKERVLGWRVAASIAWSVLLLPLCTAAFISVSSVDFFHPIQWVSNSFNDLYTSYVVFCILLMSLVILVISIFNVEFYAVVPSIPCSRLALIGKVIHPRQVIHSVVHATLGMLVAWCAAVLTKGKFQFLALPCTDPESLDAAVPDVCLNEYHLFLLLLGAFVGYGYSLRYLVNNMNYLLFPIIQQYKYLRFRRSLPLLVKHSCVESLYLVRNFCAAYYFFGKLSFIDYFWCVLSFVPSNLHPLDTLAGLLDLSLLYHSWLGAVFLLLTWYVTWLLFKIYATEFLALQDLMFLSQYSPARRQEVFSLSQPGGHPHNWTAISKECLNLLSELTQKLITHQEAAAANGRVKQPSARDLKISPSPSGILETSLQTQRLNRLPRGCMPSLVKSSLLPSKASPGSDLGSPLGSPFGSPALNRKTGMLDLSSPWHGSVQSPHIMRRGPKLWTSTSGGTLLSQFSSCSCKASIQAVFADAQMHIWALEGLSHLVAASFTEDRFGVVQTTLPAILNTFLTLQEVVDKHFKLPHASSKPPRIPGSLLDTSYKTLRFALRASLKTAIYRITTTFGEHLNAVQVSAEHKKRLQQFLEFKE
uniref:Nucleoporin NDC1 n=1 Tax=Sphenodon punctatus TaxID=8508 RepID=A0A8D0L974_SPHPU